MTVHYRNVYLKAKLRKHKYEHSNKIIETAVNNIHDTEYLYNTWALSRYFWFMSLTRHSRKYLILAKKIDYQYFNKENNKVKNFKNFKTIYLN
jgi:hypothetical protein